MLKTDNITKKCKVKKTIKIEGRFSGILKIIRKEMFNNIVNE